jgi:hypothetical protein
LKLSVSGVCGFGHIVMHDAAQGVPESNRESFKQQFQVPKICQANNLLPCPTSSSEGESAVPLSPMEKLFISRKNGGR